MTDETIVDVESVEVKEEPEEQSRPMHEIMKDLRDLKRDIKKSMRYRKSNIYAIKQLG